MNDGELSRTVGKELGRGLKGVGGGSRGKRVGVSLEEREFFHLNLRLTQRLETKRVQERKGRGGSLLLGGGILFPGLLIRGVSSGLGQLDPEGKN